MTLANVIRRLPQLDDTHVIYCAPRWSATSRAAAMDEPLDGSLPEAATGMTYLLDVHTAKWVVRQLEANYQRTLTHEERTDAILYYAVYEELEPAPYSMRVPLSLAM